MKITTGGTLVMELNQNQSFANAVRVFENFVDSIQHLIDEEHWDEFNFYYIQSLESLNSFLLNKEEKN